MSRSSSSRATYVLIHGAGGFDSRHWHLVVPELRARGHDVVAPDLPSDDTSGLTEYADTVVDAIGDRTNLVVVAHSLGGFTGSLVCARVPADLLVLVTAMVPAPGETAGDWWANTGWEQADPDPLTTFFHDVSPDVTAEATARTPRHESGGVFTEPWPLDAWPDVPTRFLLCRDDRFFPAPFMRRVVRDRLGIVPDEMDGGHLPALSRPKELAAIILSMNTMIGGVSALGR